MQLKLFLKTKSLVEIYALKKLKYNNSCWLKYIYVNMSTKSIFNSRKKNLICEWFINGCIYRKSICH